MKCLGREKAGMPHNLVLENRRKLQHLRRLDVDSFDESTIIVNTEMGELTIQGQDLHINNLSIETGEMCIEGSISTLLYSEIEKRSGGFFSKVFR